MKEHIPAILTQWYPGEQGGEALVDVLLGEANPSGKLNYSFPQSVGHLPCFYNYLPTDKGFYRSPGSPNKPGKDYVFATPKALWAFGHGLSYTEFEYLSAVTSKENYGQDEMINVTVKIRNIGNKDGITLREALAKRFEGKVQLHYARGCDLVTDNTPVQELKAFKKILIKKGETTTVTLSIPVAELALYDKNMKRIVEPGAFELQIGRASDDIRIKKIVTVERDKEKVIPTVIDKNRKKMSDKITSTPVVIKGVVRDVQANLLPGVPVKVGRKQVITDENGNYTLNALSTDTLIVGGGRFKAERIPIDGRQVINVRLLNQ